jgi:hypothetical protein
MGEAKRRREAAVRMPIPDDIKSDIAKVARSIDVVLGIKGGICFFRALAGYLTLMELDLSAALKFGGMVYRAGPDEERDVIAFCGRNNLGWSLRGQGVLGHYFLTYGDDIVDFSVGDWKSTDCVGAELEVFGKALGDIVWTAPPLPEFFWQSKASLKPDGKKFTPELGRAWYTGAARGAEPNAAALYDEAGAVAKIIAPSIFKGIDSYALRERLHAVHAGHKESVR